MAHIPEYDDPPTDIALFRYGLIAALVHQPPDPGDLEAALRHIAAGRYTIPHSTRTTVSLSTVRRYLRTYLARGFDGLRPKGRADAGAPRAFSAEALERAIALREQSPGRTTPMLAAILARDGMRVNAHTLATHLRRAGKTRRQMRAAAPPRTRFERDHVNSLWQSDAMHGPYLPDPAQPGRRLRTHLFAFIDDHSRLVPYGEFFFDEALPRLERVLKLAILRRGLPKALYVDNGQVFHATQFAAACASLGIRVLHTRPYDAPAKGKIERFWKTVQDAFLPEVAASNIADLATLNASFQAWLDRVYHSRVHAETGQSPFERFTAQLDLIRTADAEQLRLAFQWRVKRSVSAAATLAFQGNVYQVDPTFAHQPIELRFDPFDLSRIDVYLNGKLVGPAVIVRHKRQFHLQVERLVPADLRAAPAAREDFLKRLRDEHDAALRQQIGHIRFATLHASDTPIQE